MELPDSHTSRTKRQVRLSIYSDSRPTLAAQAVSAIRRCRARLRCKISTKHQESGAKVIKNLKREKEWGKIFSSKDAYRPRSLSKLYYAKRNIIISYLLVHRELRMIFPMILWYFSRPKACCMQRVASSRASWSSDADIVKQRRGHREAAARRSWSSGQFHTWNSSVPYVERSPSTRRRDKHHRHGVVRDRLFSRPWM